RSHPSVFESDATRGAKYQPPSQFGRSLAGGAGGAYVRHDDAALASGIEVKRTVRLSGDGHEAEVGQALDQLARHWRALTEVAKHMVRRQDFGRFVGHRQFVAEDINTAVGL